MKIGILTQPLSNNYGGILQNFAMQKVLIKLGHEPTTVNIQQPKVNYTTIRLILSSGKRLLKKVLGDKRILFINPQKQVSFLTTPGVFQKRFIESNISQITVKAPIQSEFDKKNDFNAYIVGSDQVWRPRFSPYLLNYYLDFVSNSAAKKIAYAASFGVDNWEASKEITPQLSEYAQRFNAVSVRETSGINLCKNYLKVEATQTLDPTMLLEANDYRELIKRSGDDVAIEQNSACLYILDTNKDKMAIANAICQSKNLQIHSVGKASKKGFPSIESWLNGFDKADFVITDSFHGTAFAILFNKPFISIGNEGRGLSRFTSLLKLFGLTSRLVLTSDDLDSLKEVIDSKIDFNSVNEILYKQRALSESFLINALNH